MLKIFFSGTAAPNWKICRVKTFINLFVNHYPECIWYLVWSIPDERRFNFVQMKSLGSCMALTLGLKLFT